MICAAMTNAKKTIAKKKKNVMRSPLARSSVSHRSDMRLLKLRYRNVLRIPSETTGQVENGSANR